MASAPPPSSSTSSRPPLLLPTCVFPVLAGVFFAKFSISLQRNVLQLYNLHMVLLALALAAAGIYACCVGYTLGVCNLFILEVSIVFYLTAAWEMCRLQMNLKACLSDMKAQGSNRFLCLCERSPRLWPWLRDQQISSLREFLLLERDLAFTQRVFDSINSRFKGHVVYAFIAHLQFAC